MVKNLICKLITKTGRNKSTLKLLNLLCVCWLSLFKWFLSFRLILCGDILFKDLCGYKRCLLCPGGDAGSCLEAGCPEYGIFHPSRVVERNGLTAVCHIFSYFCFLGQIYSFSPLSFFFLQTYTLFFEESVGVTLHISKDFFSSVVRCDSTERLRNSLDYLRSVLNESTSFKLIYRYAFDFARVRMSTVFFFFFFFSS